MIHQGVDDVLAKVDGGTELGNEGNSFSRAEVQRKAFGR